MPSFEFAEHKRLRCTGGINLGSGGTTYKVLLLKVGTSCAQEPLITNLGAFSALAEFAGAGYVRGTLGSQTLTVDPTTAEAVFDAANQVFAALTNDTAKITAALLAKDGANDAARVPAFYIDRSPAFDPGGLAYTLEWSSLGIFRV